MDLITLRGRAATFAKLAETAPSTNIRKWAEYCADLLSAQAEFQQSTGRELDIPLPPTPKLQATPRQPVNGLGERASRARPAW